MNVEDIMLSEISQTEKENTALYHLSMEFSKSQTYRKEGRKVVARSGGWGE